MSVNPVTGVAIAAMSPAFAPAILAAPAAASAEPATTPSQFYSSPIITLDDSGLAVLQFRDSGTGEVIAQVPPEQAVQQYRMRGGEPGATTALPVFGPAGAEGDGVPAVSLGSGMAGTAAENGGGETGQKVAVNA